MSTESGDVDDEVERPDRIETDARLRAALEPHVTKAAVLVVAQRVSTIRNAHQILVLEDGGLVGVGTHDELLEAQGAYWRLYRDWMEQAAA